MVRFLSIFFDYSKVIRVKDCWNEVEATCKPASFSRAPSLTRMTESEKKNRKEMSQAYEGEILKTTVKQKNHCTRD